jgi:hypothetical protein
MKTSAFLSAWAAFAVWASCGGGAALAADPSGPETVVVTFHVREGKEAEMEKLLREDHWPLLRKLSLVRESPHVLVRGKEADGKPYFKEVLTWRDHETPDNVPPEVQAVWKRMYDFVEKRGSADSIEIDEVDLLIPPH